MSIILPKSLHWSTLLTNPVVVPQILERIGPRIDLQEGPFRRHSHKHSCRQNNSLSRWRNWVRQVLRIVWCQELPLHWPRSEFLGIWIRLCWLTSPLSVFVYLPSGESRFVSIVGASY